jgi:hypothetical protein
VTVTEAGGGQWLFTIESTDGTVLSRSTPYINKGDAQRGRRDRRGLRGRGDPRLIRPPYQRLRRPQPTCVHGSRRRARQAGTHWAEAPTPGVLAPVRIAGRREADQLHDLDPDPGEHDTLHRQTLESQQARRIIATVNHGPWLSSRCS